MSVKVDKRSEAFVFAAALGVHSPALFESKVLRSAHVRAGSSIALPDVFQLKEES